MPANNVRDAIVVAINEAKNFEEVLIIGHMKDGKCWINSSETKSEQVKKMLTAATAYALRLKNE